MNKEIKEKLAAAYALIQECQDIADREKSSFNWELAYGMGGTYYGDPEEVNSYGDKEAGWQSSSSDC